MSDRARKFKILYILLALLIILLGFDAVSFYRGRSERRIEEKMLSETVEGKRPIEPLSEKEQITFKLYFSDASAEYLVAEERKIDKDKDTPQEMILQLIRGPKGDLYSTIPPQTELKALYLSDGVAYVDFNQNFIKNQIGGSAEELLSIYSIVNTLTEFPDIDKVQILVEGEEISTVAGHIDTSSPLDRNESLIAKQPID